MTIIKNPTTLPTFGSGLSETTSYPKVLSVNFQQYSQPNYYISSIAFDKLNEILYVLETNSSSSLSNYLYVGEKINGQFYYSVLQNLISTSPPYLISISPDGNYFAIVRSNNTGAIDVYKKGSATNSSSLIFYDSLTFNYPVSGTPSFLSWDCLDNLYAAVIDETSLLIWNAPSQTYVLNSETYTGISGIAAIITQAYSTESSPTSTYFYIINTSPSISAYTITTTSITNIANELSFSTNPNTFFEPFYGVISVIETDDTGLNFILPYSYNNGIYPQDYLMTYNPSTTSFTQTAISTAYVQLLLCQNSIWDSVSSQFYSIGFNSSDQNVGIFALTTSNSVTTSKMDFGYQISGAYPFNLGVSTNNLYFYSGQTYSNGWLPNSSYLTIIPKSLPSPDTSMFTSIIDQFIEGINGVLNTSGTYFKLPAASVSSSPIIANGPTQVNIPLIQENGATGYYELYHSEVGSNKTYKYYFNNYTTASAITITFPQAFSSFVEQGATSITNEPDVTALNLNNFTIAIQSTATTGYITFDGV